jgi:hypothetical protein
MRKLKNYDSALNLRIPTALLAHAREIAHREGLGLAAFARQSIQRNISWTIKIGSANPDYLDGKL